MKDKKTGLTPREKRFCCCYAGSGNAREAAACAGYPDPVNSGSMLLLRDDINNEINRIYEARAKSYRQRAKAGYERLAFGSICDAVRLMFENDPLEKDLSKYDLFNVAEIKRPKDGAMEIKFFDRIKALEKLECADDEQENKLSRFYAALVEGSKNTPAEVDDQ